MVGRMISILSEKNVGEQDQNGVRVTPRCYGS